MKAFRKALKWFWEQLDTTVALCIGLLCSILGLVGFAQSSILVSATLGVLTVIAFSMMRDRYEREKLQRTIEQVLPRLFQYAFKVVLVIDRSIPEKASPLRKVLDQLSIEDHKCVHFCLFQPAWKDDKIVAVEVTTSKGERKRLCEKMPDEDILHINESVLDALIAEIKIAHQDKNVIVLDGITEVLSQSKNFQALLTEILDSTATSLYMSVNNGNQEQHFLQKIKYHYRSTVVHVLVGRESEAAERVLAEEIKSSLFVAKSVKEGR